MEKYWNAYLDVIKHRYFQFEGRAGKEEFWSYFLVNLVIALAFSVVGGIVHLRLLGNLYALATLAPSLGIGARRLHDTGKSGWLQLIGLLPLLGLIVLIVFWIQDGDSGANAYGTKSDGTVAGMESA